MPRSLLPLGIALAFLLLAALATSFIVPPGPMQWLLVLATGAAGYMALNVGANDVANNVGPAVGAKAISMVGALALAALFDAAGALLAGSDVVATVASELLVAEAGLSGLEIALVMIAALVAAALWINLSTVLGAPVSTTHAIIGAIMGAGVSAAGLAAISWPTIGIISASWVISPLMGAAFAALLHGLIRRTITKRPNKLAAARLWLPLLMAAMAGIFAIYLATKVLSQWFTLGGLPSMLLAGGVALLTWFMAMPWVRHRSLALSNRKKDVAKLFRPALIIAAALLSFAHGANDVANALGPLVAVARLTDVVPVAQPGAPWWSLLIGASGIALGIALFGPRVIHTVGEQITKLNEIRAFCVALSAATTVLAAATLGLPVSSTHVAVGAVFGVGFVREFLAIRNMNGAAVPVRAKLVDASMLNDRPEQALARERRNEKRYLVRRLKVVQIGVAWVVTLPAAALLGAVTNRVLHLFIA